MLRRIAITSIAPLFPDAVYGGSQAVLSRIAIGLAEAGAEVDLICSARPENSGGFELAPGVRVRPLLRLTGAFPDPYEVPPADLAATARDIAPLLKAAELVYLHADIFHFRDLIPATTPIVRSFHDFHYETALVSAFAHSADLTIVPSRYVADCIRATVGASGLREMEPVRVIPNGIDTDRFTPDGPSDVEGLPSPVQGDPDDLVLLYPHRPDERKGIFEALTVLSRLDASGAGRRIRLVVPRHLDAGNLPFMADQYAEIDARARQMGLSHIVEYVPWVSQEQMPNFYRYGDVTLCLGNIIEAFGLTPYESIACGTPAVVVNVGGYRGLPDHPGLRRIDYGDHQSAVAAIRELAEEPARSAAPPALSARFTAGFTESRMVNSYVEALLGDPPAPRSRAQPPRPNSAPDIPANPDTRPDDRLMLAPWCYAESAAIYDDYAYGRRQLPSLAEFFRNNDAAGVYTEREFADAAVPADEMAEAMSQNVLIQQYA